MEAPRTLPIFGEIPLAVMQQDEMLTRTVMPLVRDACRHTRGRFSVATVAKGLIAGDYRLWGVMRPPASLESIAVTKVEDEPGGKVFWILTVGPRFEDMFQFFPVLVKAAARAGCAKARIIGPQFWGKQKIIPAGWSMSAVIYEKDVEPR